MNVYLNVPNGKQNIVVLLRHRDLSSEVEFLQKPFNPEVLVRKIQELLGTCRSGVEIPQNGNAGRSVIEIPRGYVKLEIGNRCMASIEVVRKYIEQKYYRK